MFSSMSARVALAIITLAIMMITIGGLPAIIITSAYAQTTTASPATNNSTSTTTTAAASSSNKIIYLFTAEHQGVNQTKLGIPPDTFSPDIIEANTGDNISIHFYNLDATDSHTFTIGSPYNIDKVVAPGQNATFKLKAAEEGIYRFYCRFHLPTMEGQLIVHPPPVVEKPTPVTK
jgi:plastocyanin